MICSNTVTKIGIIWFLPSIQNPLSLGLVKNGSISSAEAIMDTIAKVEVQGIPACGRQGIAVNLE